MILRRIAAHEQLEGGGFRVRRPLPTAGLDVAAPFPLIDEMGPMTYAPGEAPGGAPLNDSVGRYGPFVMNEPREIEEALRDHAEGRLTRDTSRVP